MGDKLLFNAPKLAKSRREKEREGAWVEILGGAPG